MTFRPCPKPEPRAKKPPKPIKAKNVQRSADEFARCYLSEERVQWVKELPCVVGNHDCINRLRENVHVEGEGAGRKAGYAKIVSMCGKHHRELHSIGREEFEGKHLVDLAALALDTERIWRRYANT